MRIFFYDLLFIVYKCISKYVYMYKNCNWGYDSMEVFSWDE